MIRRPPLRSFVLAAVLVLAACSDCDRTCKEGITFYVADVTGALAPGTSEQLYLCVDDTCKDVTVSRSDSGPTVFFRVGGLRDGGDHTITVKGTGSLQGEYKGPLSTFTQQSDDSSCGSCQIGAVKISADGTLTPGEAAPPAAAPSSTPPPETAGGASEGSATSGG